MAPAPDDAALSAALPIDPGEEPSRFVDALRGFALAGIAVIHMEGFIRPYQHPAVQGGADRAVTFLSNLLADGKFFPIFAFLFGFGLAEQFARGRTGGAMARRLAFFGALGAAHAVLLFAYDILTTYALLGIGLWWLRDRSERALAWIAAAAAGVAVLSYGAFGAVLATLTPAVLAAESPPAAEVVAALTGSFREAVAYRIRFEIPFALVSGLFFNGPLSFAAACLGMAASRRGLLREPGRLAAALSPHAALLVAGAVVGNLAGAVLAWRAGPAATVGMLAWPVGMACLSALYVLGLACLWARPGARRAIGWLAPAGRMSLTNYIGQSLLASAVFMGWGLSLYGEGSRWMAPPLGLASAFLLAAASRLWLERFRTGPLEWLLRAWTGLRLPPLLRRPVRRAATES